MTRDSLAQNRKGEPSAPGPRVAARGYSELKISKNQEIGHPSAEPWVNRGQLFARGSLIFCIVIPGLGFLSRHNTFRRCPNFKLVDNEGGFCGRKKGFDRSCAHGFTLAEPPRGCQ